MLEGTHEIVVTMVFNVPPGQDPVEGAKKIGNNGFSISCGLLPFCKKIDVNVQEVEITGPKLHGN